VGNVFRRKRRLASNIFERADKLEMQAKHPGNTDDPAWLQRIAEWMRFVARRRERARVRKLEERRKRA
jgi:hypothetical protein